MQLSLTITDGPTLPTDALKRFVDNAHQEGKDPSVLIAEFIIKASTPTPTRKRGTTIRKGAKI